MAETQDSTAEGSDEPRSFAALRHPGGRAYLIGFALAMMADNIEHVISYWIIFDRFHSPALGGFAVFSHWVPFLLFSVWSGALADRFDPRRIIQIGLVLFVIVSVGWGVLFLTGTLEIWHAGALLIIHGLAGVLWGPAGQLLVHEIVGPTHLQSAVRLISIFRMLGVLMGPAIGGLLMLAMGPANGILINVVFYLPFLLWLWKAPYGPRFRKDWSPPPRAMRGLADIFSTIRTIAGNPIVIAMTLLAGAASLMIGSAHQAQMPEFSADLGFADAGIQYSMLLGANAVGALVGGLILESRGLLTARPRAAFLLVGLWGVSIAGFAATNSFTVALVLLFVAGFLNLAHNAMTQTLVQLHAPREIRGRAIGAYNTLGLGLRAFSGVIVGFGGAVIGIHWSLGLSAMALVALTLVLASLTLRAAVAEEAQPD